MSQLKIKNGNNWESIPAGGVGVPSGGTAGQVLRKSSNADYATEWATPAEPGITTPETVFSNSYVTIKLTYDEYLKIGWLSLAGNSSKPSSETTYTFDLSDYFTVPMNIQGGTRKGGTLGVYTGTTGSYGSYVMPSQTWDAATICFPIQ